MKLFTFCNHNSSKASFISLVFVIICGITSSLNAQQIIITPGTNLILNGNVSLVLNNAALQNDGAFAAGTSTVNFIGHKDSSASYIAGSSTTTFNNLSVSKSASGVALKSAVAVKNILDLNNGDLFTYNNLTLKSDAALTARVAPVALGSNIIGKTNVERYVSAKRIWRLITAPVTHSNTIYNSWQNNGLYVAGAGTLITGTNPSAANGLDYSAQNTASMKGFNYATQQFTKVLNTRVAISSGNAGSADNTGYFIFIRGDRNPLNTNTSIYNNTTLTSTGDLQIGTQTFTASPVKDNYTLIGNPYASPVNFDKVKLNNIVKRFYVWDPALNAAGGYIMLDDVNNTGTYLKSVLVGSQTKDIQSGQAFFVQTKGNNPASLIFNEDSKSVTTSNLSFRPLTPNTPAGPVTGQIRATLNILNSDSATSTADGAIAQFNDAFSAQLDQDDAAKFANTNENLSIVRNNVLLAAERRPALSLNDTVYFRLTTTTQRSYQFIFEAEGLGQPNMTGFLEDSYLGTSTLINLEGSTTVNFAINAEAASAAINRFRIVFKTASVVLPVTISSVKAFQKNSNITVEWKVENELNMVKYDVEKSTDGSVFTYVNTTNVSGTNNSYNTYSWIDVKAVQGNNFYRIKSYDRSGEIKYSSIVKVTIGKITGTSSFSVYSNPVTGNVINLAVNNQPAGKYQVRLTNISGQSIFVKTIQINGGNSTQSLNAGSKLPAGIYQLEIIGQDNKHNTQKIIVE
ncbi:MAG: T9SS type A sorting domain-containing protein [Ferruginibacter sp.]